MADESQESLREALKRVAVVLKEGDVPFALAGGYAAWARGGPEPDHDVDFLVTAADAPRAAEVVAEAGLEVSRPPEDWLFKVFTDGAMVDVFFRACGRPADMPVLDRADEVEVLSVVMPVLDATDLMVQKLCAMDEHMADLSALLPVARALREQIDWRLVEEQTDHNDFAAAFLFLARRLGVA